MSINPSVRRHLSALEKPTIVKSLKNGLWYCGVNVTQTLNEKHVARHWAFSEEGVGTLDRTFYGRGETKRDAYNAWISAFSYRARRLPASNAKWRDKQKCLRSSQTYV